ncbi:uncharacterized protein [Nicotiana tomentosiformis]|uniref:uncharacterized protein n=1 Tax=Nicotiana tomentosiformis TaxID=4098 RepID=UPI00388C397D
MLKDMGFGAKWIKWISFCIKTVKFSIIVNGSPEEFFASERGLRQVYPLSPFLFLIAMEGLGQMLQNDKRNGWIWGFSASNRDDSSLKITHLLYADDSLVFCEAKVEKLRHLRLILVVFEAVSELHVNWRKSMLFPIKEVPNIQQKRRGSRYQELKGTQSESGHEVVVEVSTRTNALWRKVIYEKYGQLDQWCTRPVNTLYGVGVWKVIRKIWNSMLCNTRIKVENGRKTLFWNDSWLGHGPLKELFPEFYCIAIVPDLRMEVGWGNMVGTSILEEVCMIGSFGELLSFLQLWKLSKVLKNMKILLSRTMLSSA